MYRFSLSLAVVVVATVATALADEPSKQRVALVIGNDKYESMRALNNAVSDSQSVAGLFRKHGWHVIHKENIDRDDFEDTLLDFEQAVTSAKEAVVYYSGHGLEVKGRNYLAPIDARVDCKRKTPRRTIKLDTLFSTLSKVPNAVILFDACRDNPLPKCPPDRNSGPQASSFSRAARALSAAATSNTLIGFSTELGDVASDGASGSSSPYAAALVSHLSKSPSLNLTRLLPRVREDVMSSTQGRQRPENNIRGEINICLKKDEDGRCNWTDTAAIPLLALGKNSKKVDIKLSVTAPSIRLRRDTFLTGDENIKLEGKVNRGKGVFLAFLQNTPIGVDNSTGTFSHPATIRHGENRLQFKVIYTDRSYGLEEIRIHRSKELVDLVDRPPYALLIGNANYEDNDLNISGASHRDVDALAKLLREHYGFHLEIDVDGKKSSLILKDADRATVMNKLQQLKAALGERDRLLVFYAGRHHRGASLHNSYWIPTDAAPDKPWQWIDPRLVFDVLHEKNLQSIALLGDTCVGFRPSNLTRSGIVINRSSASIGRLREAATKRSRVVLASNCYRDSQDGEIGKLSPFVRVVVDQLKFAGTRFTSFFDLYSATEEFNQGNASRGFASVGPRDGEHERPEFGHHGGDFVFVRRTPLLTRPTNKLTEAPAR